MKLQQMNKLPQSQQGMVLITGLLLLLVLTLLGVTSMDNAIMEESMVKNQRDKQVAFQAAESAMVDGFAWLEQQIERPLPDSAIADIAGPAPLVMTRAAGTFAPQLYSTSTPDWWANNGITYGTATGAPVIPGLAAQPQQITEEFDPANMRSVRDSLTINKDYASEPRRQHYRISTQSPGISAATQVVVQGIYVKRF